jgi:hypothetical protein
MLRRLLPLLVILGGLLFSRAAEASHFRYGTIAWTVPDPVGAPRTVQFTVTAAWRSDYVDGTTLQFGDATNAGYQMGTNIGTATDATGKVYTMYQYIVSHTYAGNATEFTAYFESCCRLSTLQNGSDANFRVETKVSLAAGNTGGPVSGSPAVIQMQTGGVRSYTFPAFDADNDAVTCRFGTAAETGLPAAQVLPKATNNLSPTVSSVPNGCALTWDLNGAAAGRQYVVHLVLESTHGGKTSSTAIDLVVETVAAASPTCAGSGVFVAEVGQPFSATTTGTNAGGGTLKLFTLGAPAGAGFSPASGSSGASPYSSTFSWTPAASFAGTTQVVMMSYTNSSNQSGTCFLTVQVPMCANYGEACSVGVGECARSGLKVCAGKNITVCSATAGAPSAEICDGKDNDCNGAVDDALTDTGLACASGQPGVCGPGTTVCAGAGQPGATLGCTPNIAPGSQAELCDGLDNDCDGANDNGFNVGVACSNGVGECSVAGTIQCLGDGSAACNAVPGQPGVEVCDGLDNDCDGANDNDALYVGDACSSGAPGVCDAGTKACVSAALTCVSTITPGSQTEICDGLDNDCDGANDNGFNVGVACSAGDGVCQTTGAFVCDGLAATKCDAVADMTKQGPELCDGLDNDCDGAVDDNPTDLGDCNTGLEGLCALGAYVCEPGGTRTCSTLVNVGDVAETCNGVDDDCDGDVDDGFNVGDDCTAGDGVCQTSGKLVCSADETKSECNATPDESKRGEEICADALDTDCDGYDNNGCGCLVDSDCGAPDTGIVCDNADGATFTCVAGCRARDDSRCPSPKLCTSTDDSIGQCVECPSDVDCGGADSGKVCDATNTCIDGCRGADGNGCASALVCTSPDATIGVCVECVTNADCDGTQICAEDTHTCVDECATAADCDGTQICAEDTHTCVDECVTNADCDGTQICAEDTHTCVDECVTNADCDGTQICAEDTHTCVDECTTAADCDGTQICAEDTHTCVDECTTAADCDGTQICAEDTHTCVDECTTAADCDGTQICAEDTHTCVDECATAADCDGAQICAEDTHTCVKSEPGPAPSAPADDIFAEGNGIRCAIERGANDDASGWLVGGALVGLLAAARRKRRAA